MPRAGITQEQVWNACEKLYAEGKPVTNEKVRFELGQSGSYATIGKHVKTWKERPDAEISVKDYPIPEQLKPVYEEMNQAHWNTFISKYELINNDEKIAELEKENEILRDKLEIAKQDSIRLEQLEKIRKEENERYERLVQQQRLDANELQRLNDVIDNMT
ncbi:DNA-binding protein [Nostoc sp. UHCC 0702]|nr:DNA-binding protein [Nostoc sp. UHCC 0702]